ncbi:MAG: site-specific integrase [Saprospiraceae bacterium]|nr:site-specific integrase [Candidatus Defluviibacterium haderslevense]
MAVKVRWKKITGGEAAHLVIHLDGKRHHESLGIKIYKGDPEKKNKRELVKQIRSERELELFSNNHYHIPEHKQKLSFINYFESYLESYSKKDIRKVKYCLEKFKKFNGNNVKLTFKGVTPRLCGEFKDFLTDPKNGLSSETPYDYWKRFKGLLKLAKMEGIIRDNPAEGITFKGYNRYEKQLRKNVLTPSELQALANQPCANEDVKRAFLFACYTGVGMAEIRNLTWSRIENGKISLFREKNGEQVINDLHPVALKIIGSPSIKSDLIFNCPTDPAVGKLLKKWVKDAGIEKNISFYCGRHTYAVNLLNGGNNLKTVADCMAHSSTKHTMKYLNYTDELKSKAIASLPDISLV